MINLDSISQELDRLYIFEIEQYVERCNELKRSGYKIYRNSDGIHKVVIAGQAGSRPEAEQIQYVYDSKDKGVKKESILVRAKKRIKRSINNTKAVINFIKVLHANQKDDK
jgi:hypothetical protein